MAGATFAHTHAEPFQLERAELQSILDSQLFRRPPFVPHSGLHLRKVFRGHRGPAGEHWLPDRYFLGGRNINHAFSLNRADPTLFSRERYGNWRAKARARRGVRAYVLEFV
jgi:hypothetical protein